MTDRGHRLAERLAAARRSVPHGIGGEAPLGLILGTGLGNLVDAVEEPVVTPFNRIVGVPPATAPSHAGRLVIGRLFGRGVAVLQGRLHLYEGTLPQDVALVVHLLRAVGAEWLVVTNAAGALNPDYRPGDVMLIEDHLNLTGANPLTGPNEDALGPRFPDLRRVYDPDLREAALAAAAEAGVRLHRGVYAGLAGPSFETAAERRFLRLAGADAVGMSTVLEVIAAAHAGLPVLGLSAITNGATGDPDAAPDSIEDVIANAAIGGRTIARILERLLA